MKRSRLIGLPLILLTLAACAALLAAGQAFATTSASPAALSARFGTTEDVDTLNPVTAYSYTSWEIWHLNYDTLVGTDPKGMTPRPELATSWTLSPDQLTWTFHLRKGVKWQDGQPFTSADVVFTMNYLKQMGPTQWSSATDDISSVKATDDYTVEVVCAHPKANMLRFWPPILPEHIWSKIPAKKVATTYQPKLPLVGTGPFQLVAAEKGKFYRLVKNPNYWQKGKPTLDEILWVPYTNADTMAMDLRTGALDYAVGIPPGDFTSLKNESSITTNAGFYRAYDMIGFNCSTSKYSKGNPVLLDPKFREALSWAIDRQKLVAITCDGHGKPGNSVISPDVEAYYWTPPADQAIGYDLQKAGDMLTAAGYPLKNGVRVDKSGKPITLTLMAPTAYPRNVSQAKFVTGWFDQLGLKVTFKAVDEGYLSAANFNFTAAGEPAPEFDMYLWYWGETIDPNFILNVNTTSQIGSWNSTYWSDPAYDKLYTEQSRQVDPGKRKALTDQASSLLYTSSPQIVLDYPQELEAYNTAKWTGWVQVPEGLGLHAWHYDNIDTYLNLKPVSAASTSSTGGSSTGMIVAIVVIAVVLIIVVVWLVMRRRHTALEE